jgi:aminotransferase class V
MNVETIACAALADFLGESPDEVAHAQGAFALVDAVHYAPHALVDMAALGADFLVSEVR